MYLFGIDCGSTHIFKFCVLRHQSPPFDWVVKAGKISQSDVITNIKLFLLTFLSSFWGNFYS